MSHFKAFETIRQATEAIQRNKSTSIVLRDSGIGDRHAQRGDFKTLFAALEKNTNLRKLDLSENESFGDKSVILLADALKMNAGLRRVSLAGNTEIDDPGGVALAKALIVNSALQVLDLSFTNTGDETAEAFASTFAANKSLQNLDLSYCGIGFQGALQMKLGLERNYTLQALNLADNQDLKQGTIAQKITEMLSADARYERKQMLQPKKRATSTADEPVSPRLEPVSPRVEDIDKYDSSDAEQASDADAIVVTHAVLSKLRNAYTHLRFKRKRAGILTAKTEERGINVEQLTDLYVLAEDCLRTHPGIIDTKSPDSSPAKGQLLKLDALTMYQINDYFIKPLTKEFKCSWTEFITGGEPQHPQWMISHAWSTFFCYTVAMVSMHAQSRYSDRWQKATYWCCAFANNQHDLAEVNNEDILATPFAQVLLNPAVLGTLLLCDPDVTPLSRIWCVFELHLSSKLQRGEIEAKARHLLDVAAPVVSETDGRAHLDPGVTLLQDAGHGNFIERSSSPGIYFPLDVAHVGTQVDICRAGATLEGDRRAILNFVSTGTCSRGEPAVTHSKYDELNMFIHCIFASAELYRLCCERPADLQGVKRLLELKADPTRFVRCGNTAVHAAVGADPMSTSELSNTVDLLELLLQSGADPNVLNSQLCTALDYVSKLPAHANSALSAVLHGYGAKSFRDVAPKVEAAMNAELETIVASGFDTEGIAFGARTIANIEERLMWTAKHALQLAATNLSFYPQASCTVSIREGVRPSMTALQLDRSRKIAHKRSELVLQGLQSAGCVNPLTAVTHAQHNALLRLDFKLESLKEDRTCGGEPERSASSAKQSVSQSNPEMQRTLSTMSQQRRPPRLSRSSLSSGTTSSQEEWTRQREGDSPISISSISASPSSADLWPTSSSWTQERRTSRAQELPKLSRVLVARTHVVRVGTETLSASSRWRHARHSG